MIERILSTPISAVEAFGDCPVTTLFPEEEAFIARAVESRRREFATGRACARAALARLGRSPAPILPGMRGAPQWPEGVVGSITHCEGYRAAAVALTEDAVSMGVDAEPNATLPDHGMIELIATEGERVRLEGLSTARPEVCWDRLLFSAKESVYKTWFPLTRRWLDFESADVVIDADGGTFTARLLVPGLEIDGSPLPRLHGRWRAGHGLLLTAVVIPALDCPGAAGKICRNIRGRPEFSSSSSG